MAEKISLEELVTKRIRLTTDEYMRLMNSLEEVRWFYRQMIDNNPQYEFESDTDYADDLREVDFLDLARFLEYAPDIIKIGKQLSAKAKEGKNIIGDSIDYPYIFYSKEEGLRERTADGRIVKADPYELML